MQNKRLPTAMLVFKNICFHCLLSLRILRANFKLISVFYNLAFSFKGCLHQKFEEKNRFENGSIFREKHLIPKEI
jgi:hypothetical protein